MESDRLYMIWPYPDGFALLLTKNVAKAANAKQKMFTKQLIIEIAVEFIVLNF